MKKTLKYHQIILLTIVKEDKDIIKYGTEPPKTKSDANRSQVSILALFKLQSGKRTRVTIGK